MERTSARILIVDDEPALLKMMGAYLARLGYSVETSASTEEAWTKVRDDPSGFAVAVLDGSMPGMSSAELARKILGANPDLRVIAASGYPADLTEIQAAAPGRAAFLQKPFAPEMLAAMVERMLAP
jgi:DNA-binding NtrC family response regulator